MFFAKRKTFTLTFLAIVFAVMFQTIVFAQSNIEIILEIDNEYMQVNGEQKEIDPGRGTKPIIKNSRTLLPVRTIVESLNGQISWEDQEKKVTVNNSVSVIELWIGSLEMTVNGEKVTTDVAPEIINERTMLPLRFITENLGCDVSWEDSTKRITIIYVIDEQSVISSRGTEETRLPEIDEYEIYDYYMGDYSLHKASRNGDLNAMQLLIDNGANVNEIRYNTSQIMIYQPYEYQATPLMSAAYEGQTQAVQLLIENGADIDFRDEYNWRHTALMIAGYQGHEETVNLLLENNAEYNLHEAMTIALIFNRVDAFKKAVDEGADVNSINPYTGFTPLMISAKNNYSEIAEILIVNGVDIGIKNPNTSMTSFMYAVQEGNFEIVQLLLNNGADINEKRSDGMTPLMSAIYSDNPKLSAYLIVNGALYSDQEAIIIYSVLDNPIKLKEIINKGVDVNYSDPYFDWTALIFAVKYGHIESASLLIEMGADVNIFNKYGRTALISAVEEDDIEMVKLLIEKGADVNAEVYYNRTPLNTALKNDFIEIAEFLIQSGANSENADLRFLIVEYAKRFLGTPYRYGGSTPEAFDCSGFVKYVYANFDIELPRIAADQATAGYYVEKSDLKPGDAVFFDTNRTKSYVNHAGIYIGDGKFIHASSGSKSYAVVISDLSEGFYNEMYMVGRRVID